MRRAAGDTDQPETQLVAIRFLHVFDADLEPRRIAEVQRIFRSFYGAAYPDYAERIPELLRGQAELGQRTLLLTAENTQGRMLGFALVFHYTDRNLSLLDFLVVDPASRRRGIGGALYEALREYLQKLRSRGLYFEVRPDTAELEPDPAQRRRNRERIRFYERLGARVIAGTAYQDRRPGRSEGEPFLMVDTLGAPGGPAQPPPAQDVRVVMEALLYGKYGHARDDPYAQAVIASIVDDPVRLQEPRARAVAPRPTTVRAVLRPVKVVVTADHRLHHVRERGYVERPVRLERILSAISALPGVHMTPVAAHDDAAITAVHDPDFVHYIERVCAKLGETETLYPYVFPIRLRDRKPIDEEVQAGYYCIDTFTPLTRNAYTAARAAVDCVLTGVALLRRGAPIAYAICRPPGHHAERSVYGGFCYLNNAAIAAHALSAAGRVAVLDIDFHHGNGTQDIFYSRADVLTLSIHGDPSYAYPYFAGFVDECGTGAGEGFNQNYPLRESIGDAEYLDVLEEALTRIRQFAPAYLVVSVGLDIARGDPTGAWSITAEGLERIGGALAGLPLPTLLVQEGGYDTRSLGRNAAHFLTGIQRGG
jgi:acetoin utilization deacetylase AcuC-like enzyme/ribosomal protein S18 acetylase RimI-like enzyme